MSEGRETRFEPNVPHPVVGPVPQDGGYVGERGWWWWMRTVKADKHNPNWKTWYSQPARGRVGPREGLGWILGAGDRRSPGRPLPRCHLGQPLPYPRQSREAIGSILAPLNASIRMDTHLLGWGSLTSLASVTALSLQRRAIGVLPGHGGRIWVVAIGRSRP